MKNYGYELVFAVSLSVFSVSIWVLSMFLYITGLEMRNETIIIN